MEKPLAVIGDTVTSNSGNTQGIALDVSNKVTKDGRTVQRILVQVSETETKWITI